MGHGGVDITSTHRTQKLPAKAMSRSCERIKREPEKDLEWHMFGAFDNKCSPPHLTLI